MPKSQGKTKFAYYDSNGNLIGVFENNVLDPSCYATKKEVPDTFVPPPLPLSQIASEAIRQLNAAAEQHRQKWLPAPGQALTYMEKERQARSYKAAGYTGQVPPLVQAEVTAGRYATAKAAADAIIAAADAARAALTAIEAERVAGIAAIQAAKDAASVQAALQAAEQKIQAIK